MSHKNKDISKKKCLGLLLSRGHNSIGAVKDFVKIEFVRYSNITSFFCFVNKRASYPFGIISLAHAPVNVTDFSIGSINCVRHFPQT
jgi:hypothetical protein